LITVYELCVAAGLGGLCVEIYDRSGERTAGVPVVSDAPDPGWPGDGTSAVLKLDDTLIRIELIATCMILAPSL
jgi:hypothetical protein